MRRGGRVWGLRLALCCVCACIPASARQDYGVPIEIKLWDTGRTPLAHMVDVTNGFGLKVLAEHNFLNDNNIAFSPYGLMGIMVALYEGVDGESSFQIQRGMQLPWNRNVMRIGFRDIHRTLKTYFIPEEGFLAGLALNNENVTFNDSYKRILRFYGFDLENDQLPTLPPTNATSNDMPTTTMSPPAATTIAAPAIAMTTESMTEGTTEPAKKESTTNPNAETINIESQAPTESTTASPSSAPNAESTTTTSLTTSNDETAGTGTTALKSDMTTNTPPTDTTTSSPTTVTESTTVTTVGTVASTTPTETTVQVTTTETSTTPSASTTNMQSMDADAESISQQTSQASSALTQDPTTNEVSSTVDMGSIATATETSTPNMSEMTATETEITSTMSTLQDASTTDMSTAATTMNTDPTLETLQRRKKSIVDFIFTNPPYIDDYFFYRSNYYVGPDVTAPGYDDKMFLANGLKRVQVTYMHYETVLEHAYLPHLEASALRLPLDSDRYYLLVVLPDRGGSAALGRLLARMARESDLADVYAALRPRRVRAVVPSFMVKGHITLTTDLQKLGIRDVFEPRQRDFTLMTSQAGVYVRSIEQAVSVAIRKYRPDDPKKNRYVSNRDPVRFSATYPFLYFVMDATIHVALMAGKMVDPLNSRIL